MTTFYGEHFGGSLIPIYKTFLQGCHKGNISTINSFMTTFWKPFMENILEVLWYPIYKTFLQGCHKGII